jgi:hypothetical protein
MLILLEFWVWGKAQCAPATVYALVSENGQIALVRGRVVDQSGMDSVQKRGGNEASGECYQ